MEDEAQKSLLTEILESVFEDLEEADEFDSKTVNQLRQLSADGQFDHPAAVAAVLQNQGHSA